jgi:ubiquinone/menaquinone biosynthesis C-methylase UbiE
MSAPAERLDAARRFDGWAPRYERGAASRFIATLQRECMAALDLRPADRLLDVGCGTGAAVRIAASTVERAVGVDLSPAMLSRARELAAGIPTVEFAEAESAHLPVGEGEFTAILCTTSFHHYPDPGAALTEMARVLTPGGRLVIGDRSGDRLISRIADRVLRVVEPGHVHLYRAEELGQMLYRAGFARVEVRRLFSGGYAIWRANR